MFFAIIVKKHHKTRGENMSKITHIQSRQILDSRGNPTVEVDITTQNGNTGRAAVPSGASTGSREALELRDGDKKFFAGKSVLKALKNINEVIAPKLMGLDVSEQGSIDRLMIELDGSENKENLGANALLGVSMALCRAGALDAGKALYQYMREDLKAPTAFDEYVMPAPMMNIINGGAHASNGLDIQEFMILPRLNKDFSENLRAGVEIFHNLKSVLSKKGYSTNVGDEGGFAPDFSNNDDAIESIIQAVELSGYKMGEDIMLSFDCAASEFYNKDSGLYLMSGKSYTSEELIDYYAQLVNKYPIFSIEDGLDESDHKNWTTLTEKIGNKVLTIGDDLFVTNEKILKRGIDHKEANSILVKVNQIGTISETFNTLRLAFENNMKAVISHRSGETADSFIADLAVATSAGYIKTGSASRTDRVEKYNQLLRIAEQLGSKVRYNKV